MKIKLNIDLQNDAKLCVMALFFILLASCSSSPTTPKQVSLQGEWQCTKYCPAGGEDKVAKIQQDGSVLVFINEGGSRSKGHFIDSATVVATDWKNLKASLENNGNELHWDNSTVWVKK
jgi:hypothetical protein